MQILQQNIVLKINSKMGINKYYDFSSLIAVEVQMQTPRVRCSLSIFVRLCGFRGRNVRLQDCDLTQEGGLFLYNR